MIETEGGIHPYVPLPPGLAETILEVYPDDPCIGIPEDLGCTRLSDSYGLECVTSTRSECMLTITVDGVAPLHTPATRPSLLGGDTNASTLR